MAHKYLDSAGGNLAPYESIIDAATTLAGLYGGTTVAVNENIWVNSTHSETTAAGLTLVAPASATAFNPQRVLCVSDFDASPTLLVSSSSGIIATTTGANGRNILPQGHWWFHGIEFAPASGSSVNYAVIGFGATTVGPHYQVFNNGKLTLPQYSNPNVYIQLGNLASAVLEDTRIFISNTVITFGGALQTLLVGFGTHILRNISLAGIAPTTLIKPSSAIGSDLTIFDSDLTGLTFTNLIDVSVPASGKVTLINCKLPSGMTNFTTGTYAVAGVELELINCSYGTAKILYQKHSPVGVIYTEATIVASDAATYDGTNKYSIKMVGNASTTQFNPLVGPYLEKMITDTGTAITPSFECLVSGDGAAALTDQQLWGEWEYCSNVTYLIYTQVNDTTAQIIDSATNQAAGTVTWDGDGYTTERTHKLAPASSFTPSQKGRIRGRPVLAANSTVYVDAAVRT